LKPPPKFVADAMLGSLARKLRIFGYDTVYFKDGGDKALEALARGEKRVILSSDKPLIKHSRSEGLPALLVEGRSDRTRLLCVLGQVGPEMDLGVGKGRASRCAVCNGELEVVGKLVAAAEAVPPKVLARHRLFYRCASCSKFYWRGKHWERLRRLSRSLRGKGLIQTSDADPPYRWSGP
jgi:uncharacterized protein with PIN domain